MYQTNWRENEKLRHGKISFLISARFDSLVLNSMVYSMYFFYSRLGNYTFIEAYSDEHEIAEKIPQ